jgi:hypothetical protein
MKRVQRTALLCASVSAFAIPGMAHAQAGAETSSNDIIVTATRREEKLQDVPMSVNVATGEQLEKLKIFDVKDISQLAPGLQLTNTTGRNNTTTLRGITFDPDQGTGPAVQTYYNEIPTDAQTIFTAVYDIQQIEVLRGPLRPPARSPSPRASRASMVLRAICRLPAPIGTPTTSRVALPSRLTTRLRSASQVWSMATASTRCGTSIRTNIRAAVRKAVASLWAGGPAPTSLLT